MRRVVTVLFHIIYWTHLYELFPFVLGIMLENSMRKIIELKQAIDRIQRGFFSSENTDLLFHDIVNGFLHDNGNQQATITTTTSQVTKFCFVLVLI
jgi:hypothetical protein